MRNLLAMCALLVSIVGIALIIGYSASEALIKLREDEEDLAMTLLLAELLDDQAMQGLSKAEFTQGFVTPCLGIPLLADGQRDGRAAQQIGAGDQAVTLLLARSTEAQSAAAMQEVGRDVENNCTRGITVGRVESATTVYPLEETGGDEAYGVIFTPAGDEDEPSRAIVFARYADLIVRVEELTSTSSASGLQDAIGYAGLVMGRAANPPSPEAVDAALKAQRSPFEKYTDELNGFTKRALTSDGQLTPAVGLGAVGIAAGLLLVLGAMLNDDPSGPLPKSPRKRRSKQPMYREEDPPVPAAQVAAQIATEPDFRDDLDEAFEPEPEPVGITSAPTPVFAPESIVSSGRDEVERKLEVLREARLREPRPEPATPLPIEPEVDWTARLTDEEGRLPESLTAEPPTRQDDLTPRPVDRKQLLRKLRVQYPVEE